MLAIAEMNVLQLSMSRSFSFKAKNDTIASMNCTDAM